MATAFKEKERKEITEKMKEYAIKRASEIGMKKTSVDSIVDFACISKGAFYNFYESKDELFLEIVEDWHTKIYAMALKCLTSGVGSNKDRAADALFEACNILYKDDIINFYLKELPLLLKNISDTPLANHFHDDTVHIDEVIKYSGVELMVAQTEAICIVKSIAITVLNADRLGEEYWQALRIIINSVCSSIVK